nr:NYN domain-containing protein [uncultured Brachyspira sp.]
MDGFNSYHYLKYAIESQNSNLTNKNKCIDYRKLISLFFDKNTYINKIMFFLLYLTIYILYKSNSNKRKGKISRHKAFYEILNKYCNIEAVNGRFGRKIVTDICPNCNKNIKLKKHEEKETDTALSINILYDALTNKDIDIIVIISSDTDYIPIIKMILEKTDKKIKVLFPINSRINKKFSKIKNVNYSAKKIKENHIKLSQIPDTVTISCIKYINPYL